MTATWTAVIAVEGVTAPDGRLVMPGATWWPDSLDHDQPMALVRLSDSARIGDVTRIARDDDHARDDGGIPVRAWGTLTDLDAIAAVRAGRARAVAIDAAPDITVEEVLPASYQDLAHMRFQRLAVARCALVDANAWRGATLTLTSDHGDDTTRVTVTQPAGPHALYAPDALDVHVGKAVPVTLPDATRVEGTLVAAEVVDDGRAALLTVDVPPDVARLFHPTPRGLAPEGPWDGVQVVRGIPTGDRRGEATGDVPEPVVDSWAGEHPQPHPWPSRLTSEDVRKLEGLGITSPLTLADLVAKGQAGDIACNAGVSADRLVADR